MNNRKLKVASFNISGGFYEESDNTEYLDQEPVDNIDNRLLNQIIDTINNKKIDIICFQEIITTESINYLQTISDNTDLKYYDYYELSECNIVKNTNCGIAIFSRYPLTCIKKELFPNPKLSKTTKLGNTYYSYDKGYMVCDIKLDNEKIRILTHHGFPYKVFDSTPEDNKIVFNYFDKAISNYSPNIITGDFNAENFMDLMLNTSEKYKRTINKITTVSGRKLDDILVYNNVNVSNEVIKLLSDHFIVIAEIELK